MGKVLVQYYSETGHTKEMAELVAEGAARIPGIEVRLKSIAECTHEDVAWCDGLAVGAPTHLGSIPWRMKKWWDDAVGEVWGKIDGKFGCAFSSDAGLGGGAELACMGLLTMLMNYGFLVFGDVPDAFVLTGSGLVIASGLYILWREHVRHRQNQALKSPPT